MYKRQAVAVVRGWRAASFVADWIQAYVDAWLAGHDARVFNYWGMDQVALTVLLHRDKKAGAEESRLGALPAEFNVRFAWTPLGNAFDDRMGVLVDRAGAAPTFLFPVFRDGGHFLLLSQFQNRRHFLFTFLEDYKKNPAFARPYVTLTLHDDLAKEKDIVLLRGDVEKQMLKEEADHVIAQVVESYCIASRYSSDSGPLTFNQRPNDFDLDAMLKHYPKPPVNIETP